MIGTHTQSVFDHTDWKLLKKQKLALLATLAEYDERGEENLGLAGILNWIDALQDAAAADGYPVEWLK